MKHHQKMAAGVLAGFALPWFALGELHTGGVPALSSRPGAAYTVYLDVAGFNFNGSWSGSSNNPGFTPALNDRLSTDTFTLEEQTQIKAIWSRVAQSYIGFNVNVTTVDPATGANAVSDAARQAYYDITPNLMHTVIGSQNRASLVGQPDSDGHTDNPDGKWYSTAADGVSNLGVIAGIATGTNSHTNWMFTEAQAGAATGGVVHGDYIGAISAHENGHAFGLSHQGDWQGNTVVNVYSNGDSKAGGGAPDDLNGTYVPIIGNASDRQRVAWRLGDTTQDTHTVVNDVQRMLAVNTTANGTAGAADLHLIDDGIGHSRGTATPLPLSGSAVNPSLAKGVIVPLSESNPQPIGSNNYTQDWFSFNSDGIHSVSLTCFDGTNFLVPTEADGVGMLRSKLSIFDKDGVLVANGNAAEDASTLFETYSGLLAAGTYYAEIQSFGGHVQVAPDFNAASYYDMGAYFLNGSGFAPVPEPGTIGVVGVMVAAGLVRRRRA